MSGPRTMPGSRPTRSACDLTMPTTLRSVSRSPSLPPLRIERNSGPVGISPASSYTCQASTGHAIKPRTIAIVAPVLAVEGHKLGTAERPGKFIAERFLARSRALDAQRREGRHRRLCELARQGVRLRDMRRGQSLVVWAIREGRQCAHAVDRLLMGETTLPR